MKVVDNAVSAVPVEIKSRTRAIICFGPPHVAIGFRPGEFFQVVIDPGMASPDRQFIRFDQRNADDDNELHGWQRIDALTICEVLAEMEPSAESITMRAIVKE